jgi:co-chaperonin GroES (HSP10)
MNTSGLTPVGRAVLVLPYEVAKLSDTIAIPETANERLNAVEQRAVVIAIGATAWFDEPVPRAQPGDHVLISRYAGFVAKPEIALDGKTYRLVKDIDIFCRITPKEK